MATLSPYDDAYWQSVTVLVYLPAAWPTSQITLLSTPSRVREFNQTVVQWSYPGCSICVWDSRVLTSLTLGVLTHLPVSVTGRGTQVLPLLWVSDQDPIAGSQGLLPQMPWCLLRDCFPLSHYRVTTAPFCNKCPDFITTTPSSIKPGFLSFRGSARYVNWPLKPTLTISRPV